MSLEIFSRARDWFLHCNSNAPGSRSRPYTPGMDPARMNDLLSLMTPEEIEDGLWFADVCLRNGNMDQLEADEWRRRVLARQRFLELSDSSLPA